MNQSIEVVLSPKLIWQGCIDIHTTAKGTVTGVAQGKYPAMTEMLHDHPATRLWEPIVVQHHDLISASINQHVFRDHICLAES